MPLTLSVVVPTRHEAANINEVYQRVVDALGEGDDWELLFVDDSDDETPDVIENLCRRDERVKLCHRTADARSGGLGTAVSRGFAISTGEAVVVMDADLQHPPKLIPDLRSALDAGADVAVASRYIGGGSTAGLDGRYRQSISRLSKSLARQLLPRIRKTSDPLSGFFGLRRSVFGDTTLRPDGYKILMEVLARGNWDSLVDVPYTFEDRHAGDSKSSVREGFRFLKHTVALRRRARRARDQHSRRRRAADSADLNVLILTSEAPPVVSGIAKTVDTLQRGLRERGHHVDVMSRQDFPKWVRHEIRLSAFAFFWPRVRKNLPRYDVVNLHGPVPTISEMFLLLVRTMRHSDRPAVVYTHHSDIAIPKLQRWCRIYNRLAQSLAHSADAVVVSSDAYRSKLARTDGASVEVIPWAVDMEKAEIEVAARRSQQAVEHSAAGDMRVLFVGQLRGYKGVNILIDAVTDLPNVQLTIVGDGPLRGELKQQIDVRGADNVQMTGRLSNEDLKNAYASHDVITLPSLTGAEAYGIVLAEGMASGCVPVASDLPGVAEVAAPTGLVVEPGSVDSLRNSLAALEQDRGRLAELSTASADRVQDLTIEKMASRYEAVFVDGVNSRARQRGRIAVPQRWSGPDEVVHALEKELDVSGVSVALATRGARSSLVRVWSQGEHIAASNYDASRFAMQLTVPEIVDSHDLNASSAVLLDREDASSAIFIPLRRTRRTVSLVALSAKAGERALDDADLQRAMTILYSRPRTRLAA